MRHLIVLLATAASVASLLLIATQRWGLGVSFDSVVYIQASHDLSSIPLPQPLDDGGEALYHWAPGYAIALKAFGGSYVGARFLNVVLLFAGVLLIGGMTWRLVDRRAGLIAAGLYAASPTVFDMHLALLAEPLYLVLAIAALWLLAEERSVAAGLVVGAAALTRYAAFPLILLGGVTLRGRDRRSFLAISVSLYAAWMVRNRLAAGHTTGRQLAWHPPGWDKLEEGGRTLLHLLTTPGRLPSIHTGSLNAGVAAELVAAAAIVASLIALRGSTRPPRLVTICVAFVPLYLAFVLVTVTVFDALTPLDARLLVPLFPSLAVSLAWIMRQRVALAAIVIAVFTVATLQEVRTHRELGSDYSGRVWNAARITQADLPPTRLYSTWPAAVAYFTGRSPRRVPRPTDKATGKRNENYGAQMSELARAVRRGRAALVLLDERLIQVASPFPPIVDDPRFRSHCRLVRDAWLVCARRH
jgi:hypothetical protein